MMIKKLFLIGLFLGFAGCAGGMPKSVSICIMGYQHVAVEQPTTSDRATTKTETDADTPVSIIPK